MFQHRFKASNELSGHSLGNLILAAMTSITGDFMHAIQEMSKVLKCTWKGITCCESKCCATCRT